jgi:hypothetical protein
MPRFKVLLDIVFQLCGNRRRMLKINVWQVAISGSEISMQRITECVVELIGFFSHNY